MAQRNCPRCSALINDRSPHCPVCGVSLKGSFTIEADVYAAAKPVETQFKPPRPTMPRGLLVGILLALLGSAVVLAVLGLAAFGDVLPSVSGMRENAREAEAKQNLHAIQVAVEKFAVDHHQRYPEYLLGGAGFYSKGIRHDGTLSGEAKQVEDVSKLADPLLRGGYLPSYPSNPFVKNGYEINELQLESSNRANRGDPLLNSEYGDCVTYGTRFGADCRLMGNVLCEPRYTKWWQRDGRAGDRGELDTFANVGWLFWDCWEETDETPSQFYLPGQFFYKSAGSLEAKHAKASENRPIPPPAAKQYVLGVYGSSRTRGQDVLGSEEPAKLGGRKVYPWLRSRTDSARMGGCPYKYPAGFTGKEPLVASNPNGVKDAIVLLLGSGPETSTKAPRKP
jgi:hypothetical protein